MSGPSLTPALRVLRTCLHLMVAGLLVLAVVRAVAGGAANAPAVAIAAGVFAVLYGIGPLLRPVNTRLRAAIWWLAAVMAAWLVLLALTSDGIWLAFPLFFVQLHLLPRPWALAAVTATTALAIAGFGWRTHTLNPGTVIGPVLGAAVAVAVALGYQALYRESEQRRRLIEELTATRGELAAAEHAAGVLAERERLAREIHDTLAQGLSSIQLLLRAAERAHIADQPETALGHVRHARQTAVDNLAEARRFVRALSPPDLEAGNLPAALERLCATTARISPLSVHCQISGTPVDLPTPHEVALLRIAQSALANAVQHATADHVEMTLSYMDTEIALDVVDNGQGFDAGTLPGPGGNEAGTGFGLAAMRARARALHGTLTLETAPGQGTALAVTLPLPAREGTAA
ncbi:signal transduction histidine kinase [Allocatelliglobosispora scoriae]|uniref:Oxygen sensor histidine kinase NreB n=1 Tax=Allocatelliglobosispora scoriae TaxID=643052 RepID=A0A841BTR3_9ACTN|nr:sensor histidine kinase [Allocatelliglobosispora scoriae]MBB5870816.1 signal transduction histidine kinase [Allocatelliglobosispora scoriae]